MEQDKLREWENKCTQEESPGCTAGCPLHVDVRLFIKEMARGDREAAFKVLTRTMPFPGILGRICDHPCETQCKRAQVEEPLSISSLERSCVERATGKVRVQLLPRREQKIAIWGSGLASLTTAWDLLRKGFRVTIFEPGNELGGTLHDFPEDILPSGVILSELATLDALKADIHLNTNLDETLFETLCREYDALFIDCESISCTTLPLQRNDAGEIARDAATGATKREGVFAGGGTRNRGEYSPVNETLQGRKGALSIERFIQNANISAGRENDGPYASRLFTSIKGIEPLQRVRPADGAAGFTHEEELAEASRCLQCECRECVKVCAYLESYQGYPKKYARQVFNNERVILGAARNKNQFINSCSGCGLCETVCPNGFHMGELTHQARRTMVEQKLMPASFHEFALQDMAHSTGEQFSLSRHEPGKERSAWLYFPSCQLCATAPGEVLTSYRFLRERLDGGVGIMLHCCGAPAHWAGQEELFRECLTTIRNGWESLGRPRVITACATCKNHFTKELPELEAVPLWELLEGSGLPLLPTGATTRGKVSVIDPCAVRHDPETRASVRRTIAALGMDLEELPLSGEKTECCGYGGLMFNANPQLARDMVARRAEAGQNDYLAYCALCRDNFAAAGKRVSHLIEHIFPTVVGNDPAGRGWLSWSQRRENRGKVREEILRERGEEGVISVAEYEKLRIMMTEEIRRTIDERRILENDLRQVIDHAQASGRRLLNTLTGHYRAYLQTENVTFWVEYSTVDDGFLVHNAYCHRMKIVGVQP